MAISIKNPLAEKLARDLAEESGESITQAIIRSLEERLERLRGKRKPIVIEEEIIQISERCRALPDLDDRSSDEILGYNKHGVMNYGD